MICKKCSAWNDDNANFCHKCGGELYSSTLVTSPITNSVAATNIPTTGIRVFSGIGNGYLQSTANFIRNNYNPRSDTYRSYPTGAKVHLNKNGTWICPDCGEKNGHEKLFCTSCGRYR